MYFNKFNKYTDTHKRANLLYQSIKIKEMDPCNFSEVIKIVDVVLEQNFLNLETSKVYWEKGAKNKYQNSLIVEKEDKIVGFLFAFAPGKWKPDEFCSVKDWPEKAENAAYIELIGVLPSFQRNMIATSLLKKSIQISINQGAEFIVSHIWVNSPGLAALKLFKKFGAREIKLYKKRWFSGSLNTSRKCAICSNPCRCDSLEIIIKL